MTLVVSIAVVMAMFVVIVFQLMLMVLFEYPYTTLRKARMTTYAVVGFTVLYRLYLFMVEEIEVGLPGFGIGATATTALIVLEYIRSRETAPR